MPKSTYNLHEHPMREKDIENVLYFMIYKKFQKTPEILSVVPSGNLRCFS